MAEIGQGASLLIPARARAVAWSAAAVAVAAAGALWLWPFTIDDAAIPVRYARHLAQGVGYRFNAGGPVTDGVTPLPWAFLLWPLAHGSPLAVLARAKAFGLGAWLLTAAGWGAAVGRSGAPARAKTVALAGLAVSVPVAAHAVTGMETALATSLATAASLLHGRPRAASGLAGLAASLRPEMTPWALAVALLFAWDAPSPPGRSRRLGVECASLALGPFVACALARLAAFGSPAPLSLLAKPSDIGRGAAYAVAAALVSVGPLLALSPVAAARERGPGRALAIAGGVHLVAVAVAGGDWMPYGRLVAPIVPSLLYAAVLLWSHVNGIVATIRAAIALAIGIRTVAFAAPLARQTGPDREELERQVAPLLVGAGRVAAVDIGWLSAATEGDIIDLAGVTDPDVAALGGGHTSKRIDGSFLLAKDPDALVLYAETSSLPLERWRDARFPRVVEARLSRDELVTTHFEAAELVPLGETGMGYYVLWRRR
jgi:hypothetical protein